MLNGVLEPDGPLAAKAVALELSVPAPVEMAAVGEAVAAAGEAVAAAGEAATEDADTWELPPMLFWL